MWEESREAHEGQYPLKQVAEGNRGFQSSMHRLSLNPPIGAQCRTPVLHYWGLSGSVSLPNAKVRKGQSLHWKGQNSSSYSLATSLPILSTTISPPSKGVTTSNSTPFQHVWQDLSISH